MTATGCASLAIFFLADPAAASPLPQAKVEDVDVWDALIGSASIASPASTPLLATGLEGVREAMKQRDFLGALRQLNEAAGFRRGRADSAAYERMHHVYTLWSYAWSHAGAAVGELKPGVQLHTSPGLAVVKDKTDEKVVVQWDGAEQEFSTRLSDMDVRLAAALIRHRADSTGLGLDAHVAALLVFDRESSLEDARQACLAAAQRGVIVDPLIAELELRESREKGTNEIPSPE
jgi:hypothetical protein